MKSEDNSPSNDFQKSDPNNIPLPIIEENKNISKTPSKDNREQNVIENQEGEDQNDFINFNISFFPPKDTSKSMSECEENRNNSNIILNNNILNINPSDNDLTQNNELVKDKY